MSRISIKIYDTTLRDGTQGEGISFSVTDKLLIVERLDQFGVDYIEGGFPGSNPRDIAFFAEARKLRLRHARLAAFGATRRAGVRPEADSQLRALLESGMPVLTIVGKTWLLHVKEILHTTPEENLAMIEDSVRHLVAQGREVVYDAEHFFDGYLDDPDYALRTLEAAARGGASNLSLCDTNGGKLVPEAERITAAAVARFGGDKIGVHCHNDSGLGTAVSLAGIQAGATLVQGTINGYGERVGNANLTTILPNLFLKMGRTAHCAANLAQLRDLWLFFDEMANLRPDPKAPFIGQSAFAHKGGLHANAANKVARSYEHMDPGLVGNHTRVLVSDLAGRSSIMLKARELGIEIDEKRPEIQGLIDELKKREFKGYEYEAADASFKLLVAKWIGHKRPFFRVIDRRVVIERRGGKPRAKATIELVVGGKRLRKEAVSNGPVRALDKALHAALDGRFPQLRKLTLRDYKVRILDSDQGTGARTRVLIESGDGRSIWGTVGVSDNVVDASWEALLDAAKFMIMNSGASR